MNESLEIKTTKVNLLTLIPLGGIKLRRNECRSTWFPTRILWRSWSITCFVLFGKPLRILNHVTKLPSFQKSIYYFSRDVINFLIAWLLIIGRRPTSSERKKLTPILHNNQNLNPPTHIMTIPRDILKILFPFIPLFILHLILSRIKTC